MFSALLDRPILPRLRCSKLLESLRSVLLHVLIVLLAILPIRCVIVSRHKPDSKSRVTDFIQQSLEFGVIKTRNVDCFMFASRLPSVNLVASLLYRSKLDLFLEARGSTRLHVIFCQPCGTGSQNVACCTEVLLIMHKID